VQPQNVRAAIAAIKEATGGFEEIEVDQRLLGALVGKGGETIRRIQDESGASIDINRDGPSLKVRGTKKSVKAARVLIDEVVSENKEIEVEVFVDREYISAIVGSKGASIQQMQKDSGFCKFDIVKDDPERPFVRIRGRPDQLAQGKAVLEEKLEEIKKTYRSIPLSQAMCSVVIGKGGATITKLQEDSGARISYDRKNNQLRIRGEGDDVEGALDKVITYRREDRSEKQE
jgi:polyribonucleotide nucleotidyltransferase